MRWIEGIDELKTLPGQELGASDWLEVTQSMIDEFANLTRDTQWIHTDPDRAKRESPFGAAVAHGFLTLSLMGHLVQDVAAVRGDYRLTVNYGFNRVRFPAPVPAGSRIRARVRLVSVKDVEGGVEIVYGVNVEIEGTSKPAVAAEWITRLYA